MIFLIIIIIIITINTTIDNIFITIVSNIVTDGVVIIIKKTLLWTINKKASEVTWIISFSLWLGLGLFSGESYKINKYGALSGSVCRHYNGLSSLIYLRAEDVCVYVFVLI